MCKTLGGKGKVSIVEGNPGDEFITKMRDGVIDTIKACGLSLVAMAPTNFDRQKALQVSTDQLTAHPDLNAMYCAIDDLAIACEQAIKSAGRASGSKKIVLAGHNASCEGLAALLKGDMDFTVAQLPNPIGRLAVDTAVKRLKGEQVPSTIISVGYPLDAATAKAILAGSTPNPKGTDILPRLQRAASGCK
jgi:ABC-type sugar transport system substrate-binding protein